MPGPARSHSEAAGNSVAKSTRSRHRPTRPPLRETRRTASFVPSPPRFVVVVLVEAQCRIPCPLRILDDPAALRHLRGFVRESDFIMEQLAAGVSQELLQLRTPLEQLPSAVE